MISSLLLSSMHGATDELTVVAILHDETALAGAHDIEVRDGLAYIAGKGFTSRALPKNGVFPYKKGMGGSFAIVGVKDPVAPKLRWSARDPLNYQDAETVLPLGDDRLLVGSKEVLLFDVANPAQPRLIDRLNDRPQIDTINGLVRLGDIVFGANKEGHLFTIDVSSPDQLKLVAARNVQKLDALTRPHDAAMSGELLVTVAPEDFGRTSDPGKLAVYRVIDPETHQVLPPEQWTLMGRITDRRLAGANRVMTRGSFAYVGSSLSPMKGRMDGLRPMVSIIDLTDPTKPRLRGNVDFPDPDTQGPNGLEVAGTVVFAAGGRTVQAIDVSDPDAPYELARYTSSATFPGGKDDAHDLVYHDNHLFVTAQNSHSLVVLRVAGKSLRAAARPAVK